MQNIKNNLNRVCSLLPGNIWILILIVLLGIFLRTYQFDEWLTFNPDQARDAFLVKDMLNGKAWPLLGPQAGNTDFKLGSIFYYFEYISAKIFNLSPESLAYPDLLFSILTLPLLYFFLKKYFTENISLILVFLYSISFFVITYSRFAFNPNSIQFFSLLLLYALTEILNSKKVENYGWAITAGIAIGIGVQLHALFFVLAPAITCLVFTYLFFQKKNAWKSLLLMMVIIFFANIGQIIHEVNTGGMNSLAFFKGANSNASSAVGNLVKDITQDMACQIEGNTYVISSLGAGDKCKSPKIIGKIEKWGINKNINELLMLFGGVIFSLGGYFLLVRAIFREKEQAKKRMLILLASYIVLLFLIFIPVSGGVSIRYYIVEAFVPFMLLGFWIKLFGSLFKNKKIKVVIVTLVIGFFVICNLVTITRAAILYSKNKASTVDRSVLGELLPVADYMAFSAGTTRKVYFTGKSSYSKRFYKSLSFLMMERGLELAEIGKKTKFVGQSDIIFYIPKSTVKKYQQGDSVKNFVVDESQKFQNIEILKVKNAE